MISRRKSYRKPPLQIYLDSRVMKPGDVLVSMGRGWTSKAIAKFTQGKFSHAALCLAPGLIYEADGKSIFSTPLNYACYEDKFGHCGIAFSLPHVSRASLLRHRRIAGLLQRRYYDVGDLFTKAGAKYFGNPYGRLFTLLSALPESNLFHQVGLRYFKSLNRGSLKAEEQGLFCSQLIAAIYQRLRLPLFASKRLAVTVSPTTLYSQSILKEVPNAIIWAYPRTCASDEARLIEQLNSESTSREKQIYTTRTLNKMTRDTDKILDGMIKHRRR